MRTVLFCALLLLAPAARATLLEIEVLSIFEVEPSSFAYAIGEDSFEFTGQTSRDVPAGGLPANPTIQMLLGLELVEHAVLTVEGDALFIPGVTVAGGALIQLDLFELGFRLGSEADVPEPGAFSVVATLPAGRYELVLNVQSPDLDPGSSLRLRLTAGPVPEPDARLAFLVGTLVVVLGVRHAGRIGSR